MSYDVHKVSDRITNISPLHFCDVFVEALLTWNCGDLLHCSFLISGCYIFISAADHMTTFV